MKKQGWTVKDRMWLWLRSFECKYTLINKIYKKKAFYHNVETKLNFIFIHIPKTAGTSITKSLFGNNVDCQHIPIIRYHAYDSIKCQSCYKFAIVRNPWGRLFSAFNYINNKKWNASKGRDARWAQVYLKNIDDFQTFVKYLEKKKFARSVKRYIHFQDQLDYITLPVSNEIYLDYLGYFETLYDDFTAISNKLNIDQGGLSNCRKSFSSTVDYRDFYTPRMIDVVGQLYKRDIKHLNYNFE